MIILNENDILKAIQFDELLECVEKALIIQEDGNYFMPDRIHLDQGDNVHLLMPAGIPGHFSTKLVSLFPGNKRLNKPVLQGAVLLQDGKTGEFLALLNGAKLTALRTGAVGALGLAYTTPTDLDSVGLIGAGVQGFHQVLMAASVRVLKKVFIYDEQKARVPEFIQRLSEWLPETTFFAEDSVPDLLQKTSAVITATTSLHPVLPDDENLLSGKHFIGIGSYRPDMQEYPFSIYKLLKQIIVDTPLAEQESGDVSKALEKGLIQKDQLYTLGKIIKGNAEVDRSGTTFYKSVGMALFDLLTARKMYENARRLGIGEHIDF
jgi:ornithine cyclodeaminase